MAYLAKRALRQSWAEKDGAQDLTITYACAKLRCCRGRRRVLGTHERGGPCEIAVTTNAVKVLYCLLVSKE